MLKIINPLQRSSLGSLRLPKRLLSIPSTVDNDEIRRFQKYSDQWWNELGPYKALHSLNKLRVPFVRDGLINSGSVDQKNLETCEPLKNLKLLDVGCGGGMLAEPLARLGAIVTGLDANCDAIDLAKCHAKQSNVNVTYNCQSIEQHSEQNQAVYDAVIASEIIEHVTHKNEFVKACVNCLKPGGSIFITTMNKTLLSNLAGIFVAERILKLVPEGTHEYDKFIEPHKLQRILEDENCRTVMTHGMFYNFLSDTWSWTCDHSINYALHSLKLTENCSQ